MKLPRKTWPLHVGIPTQFVLKFTNPLYEEMSITLATPQQHKKPAMGLDSMTEKDEETTNTTTPEEPKVGGKVTILSPHFKVGAYNEMMEYDDEIYPTGPSSRSRSGFSAGLSSSWADGVHEKKNNYTSIIVEVIPEEAGEFKVNKSISMLVFVYLCIYFYLVPITSDLQLQIRTRPYGCIIR